MDLEIYQLALLALTVLCASYIQSVTGFGFGIFAMMFLPHLLAYTEANVLSSMLSAFTSLAIVFTMYKKISPKNLIFPLIGNVFATYAAVNFIKSQDNKLLMLLLGSALVSLSVYFFFFSGKIKIKPTWYVGLIAGVLSGIMGVMFSMGGPPVVIYFVQSEKETDNYLATISAYFVLSSVITISTKAAAGFITANVWVGFVIGFIGMLAGSFVGKLTRSKMKAQMIKRAVYAFMALSGVSNIVTSLI